MIPANLAWSRSTGSASGRVRTALRARELSTLCILLAEIAFFTWYLWPEGGGRNQDRICHGDRGSQMKKARTSAFYRRFWRIHDFSARALYRIPKR